MKNERMALPYLAEFRNVMSLSKPMPANILACGEWGGGRISEYLVPFFWRNFFAPPLIRHHNPTCEKKFLEISGLLMYPQY